MLSHGCAGAHVQCIMCSASFFVVLSGVKTSSGVLTPAERDVTEGRLTCRTEAATEFGKADALLERIF